jgi:serine/threonine protein kinase
MIATWKQHEGQAVDGIALLRLLGGGESSAVYLAERAGERCAVKLVPTEDVVAQLPLSRWEHASKLSHPHLSRILQWGRGRLDGTPLVYVAMEYAEEELAEVDRPLTPKEAREMLTPVAKVLAYLHGKGFAHGRIKPLP